MLGTFFDLGETECLGKQLQVVGFVYFLCNKASFFCCSYNHIFVPLLRHVYSVFIFTALPLFFFAVIFVILLSFTICFLIFAVTYFLALMGQSLHVSFYRSIEAEVYNSCNKMPYFFGKQLEIKRISFVILFHRQLF